MPQRAPFQLGAYTSSLRTGHSRTKRAGSAPKDYMVSPMYARLDVIRRVADHRQKADKNLTFS